MSQPLVRKTMPECVRYFILAFHNANKAKSPSRPNAGTSAITVELLVKTLMENTSYSRSAANEAVMNAIHDGFLIPLNNTPAGIQSPRRLNEQRQVCLPTVAQLTRNVHDFYCFECHLPGMLEHCRQCTHSFHRMCYRKNPERPNYSVPSAKSQKNQIPTFSSDTNSDSDADDFDASSEQRATSSLQIDQMSVGQNSTPHLGDDSTIDSILSPVGDTSAGNEASQQLEIDNKSEISVHIDSKVSIDVVCMGEIRPPNRKRPPTNISNISCKSELSQEENEEDLELCTACRLLQNAAIRNPPNLQSDELCHLLDFTFEPNRSWIVDDVPSYFESVLKLNPKEIEILIHMLLKPKFTTLDEIALKIKKQKYHYLMEFLVDVLEVQHNMAVVFGPNSTEMESTKWLVRDISHGLGEIQRCPDCVRYSHEKRWNIWFALPCLQRHELVFAKYTGFSFWPAKVVRVLNNNKYDVRFFGGNHSRALVEVRNIRPIDTDVKSLKLSAGGTIKKAMEELRYHEFLSKYPPATFSFHADPIETNNVINTVIGSTQVLEKQQQKRGRKSKNAQRNNSSDARNFDSMHEDGSNAHNSIIEISFSSVEDNANASSKKRTRAKDKSNTDQPPKRVTRSVENEHATVAQLKKIQKDHEKLLRYAKEKELQNQKMLAEIKELQKNEKKLLEEEQMYKRKQWCYWCLKEAIYLCCFLASYCSEECQMLHWKDGHSEVCKNQDDQRHSSSSSSKRKTKPT